MLSKLSKKYAFTYFARTQTQTANHLLHSSALTQSIFNKAQYLPMFENSIYGFQARRFSSFEEENPDEDVGFDTVSFPILLLNSLTSR